MADQPEYQSEVDRIRKVYDHFSDQKKNKTEWAPFNEVEVAYRCQQVRAFSALMRQASRSDLEGLKILDVGCGNGRLLRSFIDMGAAPENLYGTDIHQPSIEDARLRSPQIHFFETNGWQLPFPDAAFDLVTQFVVFSSITTASLRHELAAEMLRVVRPGGFIFWWDMRGMAQDAGGPSILIDAAEYFPGLPVHSISVAMQVSPDVTIRPLYGLKRIIAPLIRGLGYRPSHLAALFGPRPGAGGAQNLKNDEPEGPEWHA